MGYAVVTEAISSPGYRLEEHGALGVASGGIVEVLPDVGVSVTWAGGVKGNPEPGLGTGVRSLVLFLGRLVRGR